MRTLVVVPTYNEAETIGALIDGVRDVVPEAELLVVDDASPDGTADIVRARADLHAGRIHLLDRSARDGLGGAYRAGFAWALEHGYDRIVQMDADLSHPPDAIPALLRALDHSDIAVGSRYVTGGRVANWPAKRQAISRGGNAYVRRVLGIPIRDATAGFKAFRAQALRTVDPASCASNGYSFQIEMTLRAVRRGLSVTEVPITFTDRTAGTSKMSGAIAVEALWRVLLWRLMEVRSAATFLGVGGAGYVVDVLSFNLLTTAGPVADADPSVARTLAFIAATVVTYTGHRELTWRKQRGRNRRAEASLFMLFNLLGLAVSLGCLFVSHDMLGLTSRLADNLAANVVGLGLATVVRFVTYRRFVFTAGGPEHDGRSFTPETRPHPPSAGQLDWPPPAATVHTRTSRYSAARR